MLHPTGEQRRSYVESCLADRPGPVVASTDYIKIFADQIRPYVPRRYRVLGTDGFGRSDYRARLRDFFEIDRHYVTIAALKSLADEKQISASTVETAIKKYPIDPETQPSQGLTSGAMTTHIGMQGSGHRRLP